MVEAIGVTKSFGDVVAVSDVTFQIGSGITAILGPNGAGKSTLFRMLCGLTPPSRGTVNVLGENPAPIAGSAVASVLHRSKTPSSTDSPCSTS